MTTRTASGDPRRKRWSRTANKNKYRRAKRKHRIVSEVVEQVVKGDER